METTNKIKQEISKLENDLSSYKAMDHLLNEIDNPMSEHSQVLPPDFKMELRELLLKHLDKIDKQYKNGN